METGNMEFCGNCTHYIDESCCNGDGNYCGSFMLVNQGCDLWESRILVSCKAR